MQNKAKGLFESKKYIEASSLIESMQYKLKDYYKIGLNTSKTMEGIRAINKIKKRE